MLDAVGPYEVFTYLPRFLLDAKVVLCAENRGVLDDQYNLAYLRVDTAFADVPRPDVLLVPGSPIAAHYAADGHAIVDWIREALPHPPFDTGAPSKAPNAILGLVTAALDGKWHGGN